MPSFIENILTVAEARMKVGRASSRISKILIDDNGFLYKWSSTSTAADDNGVTTIKPTSVGTAAGAWVNVSRRTRYYNKLGEIGSPTRVFMDTFVPTSNPYTVDISQAGFTQVPIFPQIEVRETTRTNADYGSAKITAITTSALPLR